jgi:hypothetical protein
VPLSVMSFNFYYTQQDSSDLIMNESETFVTGC